jgi:tRNA-specific 2-thiouridylase
MIDAHLVAKKIGIPFEVLDVRDWFKQQIVDVWMEAYAAGITPNPCLNCNRHIRFGFLLNEAMKRGADYLATGHFAQVVRGGSGRFELHKGVDPGKDQSYVLSVLTQNQLAHAMFPVGGFPKEEVRALAADFGLGVASKGDSQNLCFVADGDYRRFLRDHLNRSGEPGDLRLTTGEVIGHHDGIYNFTIGQRKGIGISWSEPLYVVGKDVATNTVIVGIRNQLGVSQFEANDINWIAGEPPATAFHAEVKTRYQSHPVEAIIQPIGSNRASFEVNEPIADITPGQGAVMYEGNRVVGSGIIE